MIFTTESGEIIAYGCIRQVDGARGSYFEFSKEHLNGDALFMPQNTRWRLKHPKVFYLEYRTKADNVKIYYQRKRVSYADYKIGMFYIAVPDLQQHQEAD